MEILEKLKNFLAPVDEEVIFDDGYAKAEDAVASAGQQTQSVNSQQVVGGESINVNSVDTNPFAKAAMNRQNSFSYIVMGKAHTFHKSHCTIILIF